MHTHAYTHTCHSYVYMYMEVHIRVHTWGFSLYTFSTSGAAMQRRVGRASRASVITQHTVFRTCGESLKGCANPKAIREHSRAHLYEDVIRRTDRFRLSLCASKPSDHPSWHAKCIKSYTRWAESVEEVFSDTFDISNRIYLSHVPNHRVAPDQSQELFDLKMVVEWALCVQGANSLNKHTRCTMCFSSGFEYQRNK